MTTGLPKNVGNHTRQVALVDMHIQPPSRASAACSAYHGHGCWCTFTCGLCRKSSPWVESLDECVNPRVRQAFPDDEVISVAEAAWRSLPDRDLVKHAQGQFDVLVTIDRGFEFEHNLRNLTFGIVIVHVSKNRIDYYRPLFPERSAAAKVIQPGAVIHVGASGKRLL